MDVEADLSDVSVGTLFFHLVLDYVMLQALSLPSDPPLLVRCKARSEKEHTAFPKSSDQRI